MKLPREFYRLPVTFDADRLRAEVLAFEEREWQRHPTGYPGNSAIRLIAAGGAENDDVSGPMLPTDNLRRCPYVQQVLAHFGVVWGRSRLMRLGPRSVVPAHSDVNYHWFTRVRVHIPIITRPQVLFHCGARRVHMAAGEVWLFDNWRPHSVENPTDHDRVHLVADTTGSAAFWQAVAGSVPPAGPQAAGQPSRVPYVPGKRITLLTERFNSHVVMPPSEVEALLLDLRNELGSDGDDGSDASAVREFAQLLEGFCHEWRRLWSMFGDSAEGWPQFQGLREYLKQQLARFPSSIVARSNRVPAQAVVHARILNEAVRVPGSGAAPEGEYTALPRRAPAARVASRVEGVFDRPLFIVAAPRSGSTLLAETLACSETLWTVGGETHTLIEGIPALCPGAPDVDSNRLLARHATPDVSRHILDGLVSQLRNSAGQRHDAGPVRFLEKTPKNALRIPFFNAMFPDARFVFLWRDPRENISSIMEAWRSGGWITYPSLPGWDGPWSLLLPPGWQSLRGRALENVAAFQWETTNRMILDDLAGIGQTRWMSLEYSELLSDPAGAVSRVCSFAEIPFDAALRTRTAGALPLSRYTQTPPDPEKWRANEAAVRRVLPEVSAILSRLRPASAAEHAALR